MLENAKQGMKTLRDQMEDIKEKQNIDLWLSPSSCTAAYKDWILQVVR